MQDAVFLMDRNRQVTRQLRNYTSLITEHSWGDHSSWTGKFALEEHAFLEDAYFMMVQGDPRVYLVEHVIAHERVTLDGDPHVQVTGREASALLHTRTVAGTLRHASWTRAQILSAMFAHLANTDRSIDGLDYDSTSQAGGTITDYQRSWGDMGEHLISLCESGGIGFTTRLDGTTIRVKLLAPVVSDTNIGAKYGNATGARLVRGVADWRNYAYVLGEGEGAARRQVIVDQRGGNERRELYVDARDLQQTVDGTTYTNAQYDAMLAQRGTEKLAETRIIEYAEAETSEPSDPGVVVWYDTARWSGWLMTTAAKVTRENGTRKHGISLGEPPVTMRKAFRRLK